MTFIKLTVDEQTIELTPEHLIEVKRQMKEQARNLTVNEVLAISKALGITVGQILKVVRG